MFTLCVLPSQLKAQDAATRLLAEADTLVHDMQYDQVGAIADSLLETDLTQPNRARALLLKARVLEREEQLDTAIVTALHALDIAEELELLELAAGLHTTLGLTYELIGNWQTSSSHLDKAEQLIYENQLEWLYAQYCIRRASLIRVSSDINSEDSLQLVKSLIEEAMQYAQKYDQLWHLADSHMLLGSNVGGVISIEERMAHKKSAARAYERAGNNTGAALTRLGLSNYYVYLKDYDQARVQFDSAEALFDFESEWTYLYYDAKALLLAKTGHIDSAIAAFRQWEYAFEMSYDAQNRTEIAELTAVHENEKKQVRLDAQIRENEEQEKVLNRTIGWLIGVLLVLGLLFVSFRRQRSQTKKIAEQREDLERSLDKQKVLLAEVQHRVKNNLQVIIAMLDLQKDAPKSKSIEEITQESQKRIESMALLHDKVYLSDNLEKIKLQSYLEEIVALLHETHATKSIELDIVVNSEIETVAVDKAIPVGLITVELLMNSFKHAFGEKEEGRISIATQALVDSKYTSELTYQDNGNGYNSTPSVDGLGLEIIKGLTGQLHGKVEMDGRDGFSAKIQF